MNKVYQISNKISATTLILVAALGISSCSTYQPSGYESDGVYYNPKTDKTYDEARQQYNQTEDNPGEIKIGSPYFDADGNGAEQFYYQDDADNSNTQDSSSNNNSTTVKVNSYGLGGYNYFGNNNYTLSYSNDAPSWGRNDGVEVNIWNNYSPFYSPWGWNSFYSPWYGGGFGLSMGWGWNNWYGSGFYGGWNNWYGYPGYYGGYGWNRPRGTYAQPGNRYGNNLNSSINSNRPVAGGFNGRNNQISNGIRPTRGGNGIINNNSRPSVNQGQINNNIRPTREARPSVNQGQINNNIRPTREARPSVNQGQFNNNTRPTREVRPSVNQGQFNNNTRPARESNSGYNTRPTRGFQQGQPSNYNNSMPSSRPSYSSPSPSRGSSMGTGSFGSGSRGGSMGGGAIRGGRR
ncbi:hypothetical protein [Chishuiella sp.]|uniref:hypothetical protein n=1 Tax=Chishuiella sp. TaxID=1969467 RepID=UPI0028AB40FD|nr:hypothetical protein [Chishuiella sp.]